MTTLKRPRDTNQLAKMVVYIASGQFDDAPTLADTAQRRGGTKGGIARARILSEQERREIALRAAEALWKKRDG